jgi:hypothetical protein
VVGAIVESHTAKIAKIMAEIFFLLSMILILLRVKNSRQNYTIITTLLITANKVLLVEKISIFEF